MHHYLIGVRQQILTVLFCSCVCRSALRKKKAFSDSGLQPIAPRRGAAEDRHLARPLHLAQRGQGLGYDLDDFAELPVADLNEIHVVHAEARQAFVHAALHPLSEEIEVLHLGAVAGDLGREHVAVARHALMGLAQDGLRRGRAGVGGGVAGAYWADGAGHAAPQRDGGLEHEVEATEGLRVLVLLMGRC